LILLLVVGLGVWWIQRSAETRARGDALAAWAGVPLPSPGEPVDGALADLGAELFRQKCAACHVIYGESHVGPELAGVTHRRSLPWIQAMILHPDSMTEADPAARSLLARYQVQMMVPGGIDTVETRAVLEFLRRVDGPPPTG
jgi:mono/diheme cytochrome c family protein